MRLTWGKMVLVLLVGAVIALAGSSTILAGVGPGFEAGYIVDCDEDPFGSNGTRLCAFRENECDALCCVGTNQSVDCQGTGGINADTCYCDEGCSARGDCCSDFDSNQCIPP